MMDSVLKMMNFVVLKMMDFAALLAFSTRNLEGTQESPMVLQTEELAAAEKHAKQLEMTRATKAAAEQVSAPAPAPAKAAKTKKNRKKNGAGGGGGGGRAVAVATETAEQQHVRAVDSAYLTIDEPDEVEPPPVADPD